MGTGSAGSAFLKAHSPSFRSRAQIGHGRPIFMFLCPAALPEHCAAGCAAALRPFQADSPGCGFILDIGRIESHCAGLRDSIRYGKPFTTVSLFCLLSSPSRAMHACFSYVCIPCVLEHLETNRHVLKQRRSSGYTRMTRFDRPTCSNISATQPPPPTKAPSPTCQSSISTTSRFSTTSTQAVEELL